MLQSFAGSPLFWLTALPLAGALVLLLFPRRPALHRLAVSTCTASVLALASVLWSRVGAGGAGTQHPAWALRLPISGAQPLLAVDATSALLIWTAALLFALYALAAWRPASAEDGRRSLSVLLLEAAVLGTLSAGAPPLLLFFWGAAVVMASLLLRTRAATGEGAPAHRRILRGAPARSSLLLLLGLSLGAVAAYASMRSRGPIPVGSIPFWALFLGFMAPAAVTAVDMWMAAARDRSAGPHALAASLLPGLGAYGLLRVCLPAAALDHAATATALWVSLGVVWYGALKALARKDPAEVLAYVWLSRVGFAAFGIFTGSPSGVDGGVLQIFGSALSTAALAVVIGNLPRVSKGTAGGGSAGSLPRWIALSGIFVVSAFGLPGTAGFVAQYLTLLGAFPHHPAAAALGLLGTVLTAASLISLVQRIAQEAQALPGYAEAQFLRASEWLPLIPLAALVVGVGFFPGPMVSVIQGSLHSLALTAP